MAALKVWDGTAWRITSGSTASLPTGGTAGQVLAKASATNFDAQWTNTVTSMDGLTGAITDVYVPKVGTYATTATDVFTSTVSGEAFPRMVVNANGSIEMGGGTAATDTLLFRAGADILQTPDRLQVNGAALIDLDPSGRMGIGQAYSGSARLAFPVGTTASDGILFGGDTNLYRPAADVLQTDDTFQVGTPHGVNLSPTGRGAIAAPIDPQTMLLVGVTGAGNAFNSASTVHGIYTRPVNTGLGSMLGLYAQPVSSGAGGTVAKLIGVETGVRFANATGTLTDAQGIKVGSPTISAGGAVTTSYGLDLDPQKITGVTNGYGVYQRGASDLNYFQGNVGVGALPIAAYAVRVETPFASAGGVYGVVVNPSNSGNGFMFGLHARPSSSGASVASIVGMMGGVTYSGTGGLTDAIALQAYAPSRSSSGTITNAYGLDIQDQKPAGVTNSFGVYQRGASDVNRFFGPIALGATPASIGGVRLTNAQRVYWRNTGNTADVGGMFAQADDNLWVNVEAGRTGYLGVGGGATMGWNSSSGLWINDGVNFTLQSTTGTKFGTAAGQKMAWWGATPVVQNTGWAVTAGYTADKTFNPESTTVTELARVLGTLIDALKIYGIVG